MKTHTLNKNSIDSWRAVEIDPLTSSEGKDKLLALLLGKIPAVIMRGFFSHKDLLAANTAITQYKHKVEVNRYSNGSLTTVGPYLARHLSDLEPYFMNATITSELFEDKEFSDIRVMVREVIKEVFGLRTVAIAKANDGRSYAPAVVRIHDVGVSNPLHNDLIVRDAKSVLPVYLRELYAQFTSVLCLQDSEGGVLRLYRKSWEPDDEHFKIKNGLGYEDGVVEGTDLFEFHPRFGDLYVFWPCHYHEITQVEGDQARRTLGSFFGFFNDQFQDATFWA